MKNGSENMTDTPTSEDIARQATANALANDISNVLADAEADLKVAGSALIEVVAHYLTMFPPEARKSVLEMHSFCTWEYMRDIEKQRGSKVEFPPAKQPEVSQRTKKGEDRADPPAGN